MNMKENSNNHDKAIILSVLSMALIALMAVALTFYVKIRVDIAKSQGEDNAGFKHHYVMITGSDSQFWNNVYEGAVNKAVETNAYVERVGQSLDEKYSVYDLLDKAIYEKVDGILVEPDGTAEVNDKINEAVNNGIPVITLFQDSPDTLRTSYVGVSYYNLGQQYADQIAKAINLRNIDNNNGYDSSVSSSYQIMIIMNQDIVDSSRNIVYSAISESLKNRDDIKGNVSANAKVIDADNHFESEEAIRNIFMEEVKLPDVMVALDETSGACVYQALVDFNSVGNVEVIASFEDDIILRAIDKDIIFSTVAIDADKMGSYGVEALNEFLDTGFSSDYYSVDSFIINSANVDDYMEDEYEK